MTYTIIDCYTDEPSGLGVPPYLGTYSRYIAGKLGDVKYLTIDDVRLWKKHGGVVKETKLSQKTDITTYNLTNNDVGKILAETDELIIILGVHVPGKYLSAVPGTLKEIIRLIGDLPCRKILTGPAVMGTQLFGGRFFEKAELSVFDKIDPSLFSFRYEDVAKYAVKGAAVLKQIPDLRIIEIETGHGCDIGRCSFCTEPLKSRLEFRSEEDVLDEIVELYKLGARYFRIGKQTCFYTLPYAVSLLKKIREQCPDIRVLHIDNVNPVKIVSDKNHAITKAIVKYCSSGNIAALGVESFDPEVVKQNYLNSSPKIAYEAIKILNKYGASRGANGMPKFLPGVNIIFGLKGESKKTHSANIAWLKQILDEGLLLRRINIRQVAIFEGTPLFKECGDKFLKKNKKYYWKWRNEIRQKIDWPMLQRLAPVGNVLKDCYAEIYDGKTTFLRQFGTYPLIVGVKERLPLKKFYDVEITGHMLRSLVGRVTSKSHS